MSATSSLLLPFLQHDEEDSDEEENDKEDEGKDEEGETGPNWARKVREMDEVTVLVCPSLPRSLLVWCG